MRALIICLLLPGLAWAGCPPSEDQSDIRADLHTRLLEAPTPAVAQSIASELWQIWLKAPDDHAQALLDRGMERRAAWDLEVSEEVLDELIAYCPDYAEGYNQRAFTRFMRERYDEALADIDSTLRRNPYHFGALSGKALTLIRQGRADSAQDALRAAVAVHPYLNERHMLVEPREKDI